MPENIIQIKKVSKKFANSDRYAVEDLSIDVPRGSFVTILGTSGSGKTTLLKMINRILELTSGAILFEDRDIQTLKVENYRKQIGYVIQQIGLFPHMTVAENIAVVPKSLGWDKKRIAERGNYLLELVHLEPWHYKNRYPSQLSGGEQQRVGLARAMAAEPAVMLMDEPFGAIDSLTRQSLQDELLEIHKKLEKTILFVTHDIHEAFKLGDRVIIMNHGKVQQYDSPYNILFHPANEFVTRLVKSENILEKLQVLRASSISAPVQGKADLRAPRVREDDTLTAVLEKFLESGLPSLLVESREGNIEGQILWNSLRSIAALKNGEIEYYV
ncbi:MAG: ABC transporter ATP-binding protein [Treponema sp.]|jgi:osmoprotectant transport system ATP-binding protein|nr:ABC transporter ATP-binding protein [Treponema sp.]